MNFKEPSLGRKREVKFGVRVFGCNLHLWRMIVASRASADVGIPGIFIVRIDGVSSPPWQILKPIFALFIGFGVREHCSKPDPQWLCCET
jgi:hypothetical protein